MSQTRRTEWPPDALRLFAEYAGHREPHRPLECDEGAVCWVRDGPPSMDGSSRSSRCRGCHAAPLPPPGYRQRRRPR